MKKILIVDDDRELCAEIAEILQEEGFSVQKAYDGITGAEFIAGGEYNLVLLDLKIPGRSGLELLKEGKMNNPAIKFFIVTGSQVFRTRLNEEIHFDEEKQAVIMKYSDGILSKPFNIEQLLSRINSL